MVKNTETKCQKSTVDLYSNRTRLSSLLTHSHTLIIDPSRRNDESGKNHDPDKKDAAHDGKQKDEVDAKHPVQGRGQPLVGLDANPAGAGLCGGGVRVATTAAEASPQAALGSGVIGLEAILGDDGFVVVVVVAVIVVAVVQIVVLFLVAVLVSVGMLGRLATETPQEILGLTPDALQRCHGVDFRRRPDKDILTATAGRIVVVVCFLGCRALGYLQLGGAAHGDDFYCWLLEKFCEF